MTASHCLKTLASRETKGCGRLVFLYHADLAAGKAQQILKHQRRKKDRVGTTNQVLRRGNRSDTFLRRRYKRLPLAESGSAGRRVPFAGRAASTTETSSMTTTHDTTEIGSSTSIANGSTGNIHDHVQWGGRRTPGKSPRRLACPMCPMDFDIFASTDTHAHGRARPTRVPGISLDSLDMSKSNYVVTGYGRCGS